MKTSRTGLATCLILSFAAVAASAQTATPGRVGLTVEGLSVWQQRNDVRIPPDTGTEVSLVDLVGSARTPSVRVEATVDVIERQQIRLVFAPLQLTGRGTPVLPVAFAGTTFAPAPTDAVYKFNRIGRRGATACTTAGRGHGVSGSRDSSVTPGSL